MRSSVFNILILIVLALAAAMPAAVKAQSCNEGHGADSVIAVSLLTAAPGPEIYQLEGHSGLRIRTATSDIVANWGLFDFNAPNFVYRFVKGETDYCVGVCPFSYFVMEYEREGRRLTEQVLNLTPEQAARLRDQVAVAVRPENRTYRYNYVLDNCATRPVKFIEDAVGDSIQFNAHASELDSVTTFRKVMRHFHQSYPWYQFGIDMALGSGIDYPITLRQSAFAPVVLAELAATATIGDSIPLVKSSEVLVAGDPAGPVLGPTPWYLTPLTAMWALCCLCIMFAWRGEHKGKLCRWWPAIYFGLLGLAGCVVAFLVCISTHEATSPNWIILWVNPVCLLVPALIFSRATRPALRYYMMVNIAMICLYGITCAFGTQSPNAAFLPMALSDFMMSTINIRLTREKIS